MYILKASYRIVFNTGITYARAVLTALITFYATRLLLESLGASDFGLFNVIGGVVSSLSFLNAAMTVSTQRFISFNLGQQKPDLLKKIFANSILLHLIIGLIIVLLLETLGLYLISTKLQIPFDRLDIAKIILHFFVISTFITVISVPYDAVINARENMVFLAIVSVLEAIFKIVVAASLYFVSGDKLMYFGLFTLFSIIVIRIIKRRYSKLKYEECRTAIWSQFDSVQIKTLTTFASWNLFGTMCAIGRNQGVAIVLNLFYSTVVNAAYGIANQINGQLMFFSQTLMTAMRPQIMKSEGANNRDRMIKLALSANRLSFYLFTFFALPMFYQMNFVLSKWLKEVPEYTVIFCQAILLLTMANQINLGLMTAVQAIGKIRVYQIVAGGMQLLTLPVGYLFLKRGYPPQSILFISFGLECLSTVFRMFYFEYLTGFKVKKYFTSIILKSVFTLSPSVIVVYFLSINLAEGWVNFFLIFVTSSLLYSLCIWFFGLEYAEKQVIKDLVLKVRKRVL